MAQPTHGISEKQISQSLLDLIESGKPTDYATIVYFNSTNPTTATIFDNVNPPVTNDPLLEDNVANLYIGTDNSTWVYNGTNYSTKVVPASSNFYINGTNTDAGNNKTSAISRTGSIIVEAESYDFGVYARGTVAGVYGFCYPGADAGVRGDGGDNAGVWGSSDTHFGVVGTSDSGIGVQGYSNAAVAGEFGIGAINTGKIATFKKGGTEVASIDGLGNFEGNSFNGFQGFSTLASDLLSKLPKGTYTGTASDLETSILAISTGVQGVAITPTSTPTGTGVASWLVAESGTYTNFGGVILPVNHIGFIIRSASNVYSITSMELDLTGYAKKTETIPTINGINLFIQDTATYGQYINGAQGSRVIQSIGSTWYVTDYIPVIQGDVLYFYNNLIPSSKNYIIYNSSNVKITDGNGQTATIPVNGAKIKVDTSFGYQTLMIIKGSVVPTKYLPAQYHPAKQFGRELSIPAANIQDEVVTQKTLETKKISVLQTEYLIDSINLVNLRKCKRDTAINSNGDEYTVFAWATTDFLPILNNVEPYSWNFGNWTAYNSQKVKIAHTFVNGQPLPSNVKYVRGYWGNNQITTDEIFYAQKFFFGISASVPSPFISYGKKFDTFEVEVIDSRRDLTLPFKGKKLFAVGDSYTMHGVYFSKLVELTMCNKIGDTGTSGNGQPLTGFANNIANNHATLVAQADVVTVLGGTNDYNHGNTTLGTFADAAGANTIYGAVKGIINAINTLNPNAIIVFFTQPERGTYIGNPVNTIPPNVNNNGLNMYNISEAIYDCCNRLGVPCAQLHHTLWRLSQINIYTADNLHPNGLGGDLLGRQMAKFLNQL